MGRFLNHMADYVYDGVFLHGAESLIDFTGLVLEYLQRPEVVKQKSVRLCSGVVAHIRTTMSRLLMFRLAEMEDNGDDAEAIIEFFNKVMYWQAVILSPENTDGDFMKLICYLLYTRLMDNRHQVRLAATNVGSPYLGPVKYTY
jgi:beige protein homolog 1